MWKMSILIFDLYFDFLIFVFFYVYERVADNFWMRLEWSKFLFGLIFVMEI